MKNIQLILINKKYLIQLEIIIYKIELNNQKQKKMIQNNRFKIIKIKVIKIMINNKQQLKKYKNRNLLKRKINR